MNISFRSLDKLNRWESARFLFDAIAFTDAHSEGMPELFISKFEALRTAYDAYDEALVQEQKVAPQKLVEAEEGRDLAVRKLYALAREYSVFPYSKEKEDAGKAIIHIFKPYGTGSKLSQMPQDEETLALINLLQDFDKNAAAYEGLVTLDLVGLVDTLKIHNSDFTTVQQQRVKDDAHTVLGIVKTTRTEAQNKFIDFQEIVNALALIEGDEKYADLKTELNRLHKVVVDRAKQRTKKKDDETDQDINEYNKQ